MKISILKILSRAAAFEIDEETASPYYSQKPYQVWLNRQNLGEEGRNTFSLFDLEPDKTYDLELIRDSDVLLNCQFSTPPESRLLDIRSFGAEAGGSASCTAAIQAAIAACPPGGTVRIPPGIYRTGPLFLHSDMLLYLEQGAVLLGSTDLNDYPILPGMLAQANPEEECNLGTWEGNPLDCYASLITLIEASRAAIAGPGSIDANAQQSVWWKNPKVKKGRGWRPRTIFMVRCQQISLLGTQILNSPSWTVHPYYSNEIDILNVNIRNPADSPNTDGCDPESSQDVRIIGASISVGDDCISVKSGKYYMARYHYQPSRNILVRNCRLRRGHGAVVIGSEIGGGVYGLKVQQCLMQDTERGLRIKTRRGRGRDSIVADVELSDIIMDNVQTQIVVNMFYACDPDGHTPCVSSKTALPVDELTPCVRNIYCHDFSCTNCHVAGIFLYGLPEQPIESLIVENARICFAANAQSGQAAMMDGLEAMKKVALLARNVKLLRLRNLRAEGYEGDPFRLDQVICFDHQSDPAAASETGQS